MVRLHQFRKHKRIDTRTAHIVANQCPRCTLPLSSIPHTERHWLADMCGHPSTQKGPSTAHTAEIKVVHARLKRARELGIQAAPVVPVNYDVPRQLHEQRQDVSRQIDNLDYRLRQLEGDRVTFFLSVERCPGVVTQLKAADEHYKSRAPAKGQPHLDHNKKATLMAALLNWTATQDYTQLYETTKEEAERINSVLTSLRKPSLTDQLRALKTFLPFYRTPLQMEREVGTCSFF